MASVYVTLSAAGKPNRPVFHGAQRTEKITSSGTAALGSLVAVPGDVASIFCETAVIATAVGTATQSNGLYIPAGIPREILMEPGAQISVIDAS